ELPEHCLVRLMDVTVEPGKTYEYRMRVVMANPNFGRKDVANPTYAGTPTLTSDWSQMPIRVHVSAELRYYAVDQGDKDTPPEEATYRGMNCNQTINRRRQLWLQAHRWPAKAPTAGSRAP